MQGQIGTELRDLWDRLRFMGQEVGAGAFPQRIFLMGLAGAGKRTLFNTLWGWEVVRKPSPSGVPGDYGLFSLLEVPSLGSPSPTSEFALPIEEQGLVVYLINAACGLTADDFQWIARLRARSMALMVVLNVHGTLDNAQHNDIEQRLGLSVLPLRVNDPAEVRTHFVETILQVCPGAAIPLASQITTLRQAAAQRLIRQATVLSMAVSVEPLPLLDMPLLVGLQVHLMGQIGEVYGKRLSGQGHWELVLTVAFGWLVRYAAQIATKFLPVAGWIASGVLGASATWALGQAAIAYHEKPLPSAPLTFPPQRLFKQLGAKAYGSLSRFRRS